MVDWPSRPKAQPAQRSLRGRTKVWVQVVLDFFLNKQLCELGRRYRKKKILAADI